MRGRFAPSPTGYLHLGNIWSAFLAWLQVRKAGGCFVLRIEDIDEQRSKEEFTRALLEDLTWLGLTWDEGPDVGGSAGPYVQQKRYARYAAALSFLQGKGLLYPCYCSRARLQAIGAPHPGEQVIYDGHCYGLSEKEKRQMTKKPSWRVHVPDQVITFTDQVYGRQRENLKKECGDFVVRRADDLYAYQLAVSVDDGAMGMTHVLRGVDLLSSTPRQIWLMQTLGYTPPVYTHVPMLMDRAGNRLSKRQHGITIRSLREKGKTAEEILSHLAFAGGLVPEKRLYTREELVRVADFSQITRKNIIIKVK